uniref:E3 ubiquitin-protein ligase n=1 Tax=Panagrellus redivivus TaxID=6233 RepID=A0A7E4VH56_PANRE
MDDQLERDLADDIARAIALSLEEQRAKENPGIAMGADQPGPSNPAPPPQVVDASGPNDAAVRQVAPPQQPRAPQPAAAYPNGHVVDGRYANILEGLRSTNDIRQTEAATDLAELLLMGNEESLPNLPVREIIQQLNVVMQRENNLELTLLCVRCVSNMLEAAPRAINVIVDCIPTLLLKLKHIECIDIAEQTLIALEVMSRRNAKSILHAGGFSDAVMHVDFFSMPSQRLVYQIAANCASHIHPQEFNLIRPCLSDLIQKLTFDDKRCCESICLFFCRLIDNCCRSPERLRDIAGPNYEFLSKVQQLLTIQPSTLNSLTFVSLLQSLKHMCMRCTDIVSALIDMEFGRTLRFLIVGTDRGDATVDVNLRSPQHTREIVSLVGELLPPLPKLELFEISLSVQQYMTNAVPINVANGGVAPAGSALPVIPVPSGEGVSVVWQYVNEAGELVDLTPAETTLLEQARNNGEPEVAMELNGQPCYFDMIDMEYTNQLTNFIGRLDRRIVTIASEPVEGEGTRDIAKEKHNKHLIELVSMVFPLLVEIGSDTSCANLRYESTRVMMHMMYAIESESQLKKVLNNLPLATYIASLLSSNRNHCVTVSALQLVHVMLDKLPRLYVPLFESEGVFHMIKVLDKTSVKSSEDSQPPKKVINLRRGPIEVSATPTSSSAASSSSTAAPAPIVNDGASSSAASSSAASSSQASDPNAPSSSSASAPGPSSSQPLTIQPIRNHNMYEHNIGFGGEGALGNAQYAFTNGLMEMQTPFGRNMGFRRNTNFGGAQPFDQPFSQEFTNMFYRPGAPGSSASGSSSAHHSAGSSSNSVNSGTAPQVQSAFLAASSFKHILDDRIKAWVSKEAQHIIATYHGKSNVYDLDRGTITELKRIARNLASDKDMGAEPLEALKTLLLTKDVSSFQLNHSFLTSNLINYLTDDSCDRKPHRIPRLRLFCKVFMGIDEDNVRPEDPSGEVFAPFDLLVHKVANAVGQLEQFQVKVTNLSGIAAAANSGIASNSTPLRGSQALKLFQSNQIRCNLKRHPSCKTLREWRHGRGSIKVDPFTAVSAIERYLVDRGVGQNASESSSDNEDETEEETDLAPGDAGSPPFTGRIEIVINEHRVPSDLSVLQAIFKYSMTRDEDSDSIPTNLWTYNHTMYYRAAPREDPKASSSKQKKSKKQHTANYLKAKPIVFSTGQPPQPANSLTPYLSASLTKELYDPCAESCVLLRILYGLNTYWYTLYDTLPSTHAAILPATAFHSSKLVSKVQRQLSDFLCVATQSIPEWTTNIVEAVPFLFPFAVRRNLLYCTAFGRDRAILHLVTENSDEQDNDAGSTNRLLPRIERRRVTVKRNALLADAVITFQQMGTLEAQLEVNFDGEVGTGFGPTLEFYSTISKEIQKHSHGLWAGVSQPFSFNDEGTPEHYTVADNGLYPKSVNRAQHKLGKNDDRLKRFEFVGRLLAQALLDSRMLDIPLSSVFFKWLINQEDTIGSADLEAIDATIYKSLRSVTLLEGEDDVAALDQVFTMPGDDAYELIKNGKNEAVNKENVRNFVDLVTYWRLVEGVREEMHALRRGFEVIIDPGVLRTFAADEIEGLFCGCSETSTDNDRIWSKSALQAAIRPDHGYTHESPQIGWLVDMLHGFSLENRRKFLQFCTGSPRLPIGGFRGLNPALTVVRKIVAYGNSEGELPSAMTCYNFLKIPPYSNYETFVERFQVALQFIYSFHLT